MTGQAFAYRNGQLWCEAAPLAGLAAEYGTPLYVYSAGRLRSNYRRLAAAFAPLTPSIYYAVKANNNLALLRLLRAEGAGFDIVSGGELHRSLSAGADPAGIVFAGVGKTEAELTYALQSRVGWINVESEGELRRLSALAIRLGVTARAAIRLRPDVEADTHHHISTGSAASKFGVPPTQALELVGLRLPGVEVRGAHIHIGSQLGSPDATLRAIDVALDFVRSARAAGAPVEALDIGGGFPVAYREGEAEADLNAFAAPIIARLQAWEGPALAIHIEPGRSLVADAGALLTTVQYEKVDPAGKRIAVADAGMNTLLRPALYSAYHRVWPVKAGDPLPGAADLAGPICESADFLARERPLPALTSGDILAVLDAGAYGFAMASNYNSQPLPAEVLVDGAVHRLIRRRQTYADLAALDVDQPNG